MLIPGKKEGPLYDPQRDEDVEMDEKTRHQRLTIPAGKLRLVIDSDAKNEVDDQFAIAWALRSPDRFQVEAVYAAPFSHTVFRHNLGDFDFPVKEDPEEGMEQSYQEILKIFNLLGEDSEGRVFRGATGYINEKREPVWSDAVHDLIERGMGSEEPLYVVSIGACTNVASALIREPALAEHIVVIWLGGQPLYFDHGYEFNMGQDIRAAQHLFNCGVPLLWVPCMNVASLLSFSDDEARCKLNGKSKIGTYLTDIVLNQFPNLEKAVSRGKMHRTLQLKGREDQPEEYFAQFETKYVAWSRTIWDISTIAFLKNPGWVQSACVPSPVLTDQCRWDKNADLTGRHEIRVANYCQRDLIFGDLVACLDHD